MQLREANRILPTMIGDLRELRVATVRDDELRNLWLDDWEVLVGDRARYADAVRGRPRCGVLGVGGRRRQNVSNVA